jgi:DNA-binding transcriptional LysR family regulator
VPQLLSRFKEEHFGLQIKLEVRNRNQMVEMLRDGDIDIAIMGRTPADLDTHMPLLPALITRLQNDQAFHPSHSTKKN